MRRSNWKWSIAAAISAAALSCSPGIAQEWGYEGETAPEKWSTLDSKFILCGLGKNQSPVDIKKAIEARLEPLKVEYSARAAEIVNTGHTIQINYSPGSTISIENDVFQLVQFHFHSPSENRISGKSFPLEAHLVHSDKAGNLAVIAVMFTVGKPNPFLGRLWNSMPAGRGVKTALPAGLNARQLLPSNLRYYRFNGSLTTPPCTEGVRWLVMKSPRHVSSAQVEQFAKTMGRPNNRPLQAVNARPLLK